MLGNDHSVRFACGGGKPCGGGNKKSSKANVKSAGSKKNTFKMPKKLGGKRG